MLNFSEFATEVCDFINENYGEEAQYIETNKNGVIFHGISIGSGNIKPTMYLDDFSEDIQRELISAEEVADKLVEKVRGIETPDFDIDTIFSKEFLKDHVQLCVRNASVKNTPGDDVVTKQVRDWDLDAYLRVVFNSDNLVQSSIVIRNSHLENLKSRGITVRQLFRWAYLNANEDVECKSMLDTLEELGAPQAFAPAILPVYVLSNKKRIHGAGVIADDGVLDEVCRDLDTMELIIIPSSIHETIVMPKDKAKDFVDMDHLTDLIKCINSTEVRPEEVLSDHAYTYVANYN